MAMKQGTLFGLSMSLSVDILMLTNVLRAKYETVISY